MSWQSYVDSTLVGSGKVAKASIFGLDGSVWAISPDFTISEPEAQKAIAAFTNSSDTFASGIFLEGSKYTVLRADDQSIYASNGAIGVTIVKTDKTIIVGFYNETMQAGNCNTLVEGFAEYLRNVGY
ncbi:profilin-A [Linnemannia elongata]|nr:profilin-A [Linnemannia elongata]